MLKSMPMSKTMSMLHRHKTSHLTMDMDTGTEMDNEHEYSKIRILDIGLKSNPISDICHLQSDIRGSFVSLRPISVFIDWTELPRMCMTRNSPVGFNQRMSR